ncbi:MAG: hypothetical protein P1Q69_02590 [Candidatus Thorarchaeota archaeon]|nr:hypothetical protein [Candidatus Thorarchaeota archaeon]
MGLFDSWRRKKTTPVPTRQIAKPVVKPVVTGEDTETSSIGEESSIDELLVHYNERAARREDLQHERNKLTERLDTGEVSAIDFRKELMSLIQEAATVNDQLKETEGKLISLGYSGSFH